MEKIFVDFGPPEMRDKFFMLTKHQMLGQQLSQGLWMFPLPLVLLALFTRLAPSLSALILLT